MGNLHFFTIWTSAKPRLIENGTCIWQSLDLDLVHVTEYAISSNFPYGPRDRASFTTSEFGPQQSLNRRHMEILSVGSCQYQCKICIQISLMVQELWAIFHVFTI